MTEKKEKGISGNFVICDIQKEYAEHLLNILADRASGNVQFYLFHDVEKVKEFADRSYIDLLLAGEEYEERIGRWENIGRKIILTENPLDARYPEYGRVFRYQSGEKILKDLERAAGAGNGKRGSGESVQKPEDHRESRPRKGEVRIRDEPGIRGLIGIYSPIHRIGKTKFAIRLGQKMARQSPVLYLNMEGYSGGSYYFQGKTGQDLGDLLYSMKQERGDQGLKISAMAGQTGGMDYILPMENEQDLRSVRCSEWISLLDTILEKCIYETIILDLGDCIDGVYEILRKCTKIYTPYIREGASQAKLEQYEKNLRTAGYGDILSRTVKKQMSVPAAVNSGQRSGYAERTAAGI